MFREWWKKQKGKIKWKEILLVGGLAVLLGIAAWQVFLNPTAEEVAQVRSDEESRLITILENIDGVGKADVMISAAETGERGVVIVCEGANDISVLIDVREAAATALGIEQKQVKIYLKK
ncbi:MAG: hypothetical protein IJX98_03520 [Clostridia bacterium]|nr:hypothetical protein [Clostridia bacterium]